MEMKAISTCHSTTSSPLANLRDTVCADMRYAILDLLYSPHIADNLLYPLYSQTKAHWT
ncbi:hypothetical protein PILCRDRAFT_322619 [Piloderma croceum F 1598]|uniref:Uncharacterized protein n=1 Tax=Piloderma croceum (strain F 1598) TaxID=765440 RepID=A0A0C3BJ38_PILCF|nr:hypothetical protein PILCRDRAFT_322619 [Piloderma croceum F 1598]